MHRNERNQVRASKEILLFSTEWTTRIFGDELFGTVTTSKVREPISGGFHRSVLKSDKSCPHPKEKSDENCDTIP